MDTDRRGFLRFSVGATALALGWRAAAAGTPADAALAIHRDTRNTRLGALGTRVRAARGPLPPWKPYPGRPRLRLPEPDWRTGRALFDAPGAAPTADPADAPLSRAALSRLLLLTNGATRRDARGIRRAAPSAGALYAGEVYVVVGRVEGVDPGVYYYAVRGHALVPVSGEERLPDLAAALERPGDAVGAAAAVVLTNVFDRYRVRYANRGYRYALIDSGHIGENLRLAAAELDLPVRSPRRFEDDPLNALLGVDGREEAVCAVHLLGRRGGDAAATSARRALRERGPDPGGATRDLTVGYHAATKLVAAGARMAPEATPAPARASAPPGSLGDGAPTLRVHAAIRARRSAARFEPAPLALPALRRTLAFAHAALAPRDAAHLALHVVAHRVEGLAPGHHLWDAAAHDLAPRRTAALADALVRACLGQAKSGEAAVAVIGVARLADAAARDGARSYRDLLLDAGAAAQRLYLGAEAHGLAARNLAAYYDDELDALLGLDGEREVAVHLTALGPGD